MGAKLVSEVTSKTSIIAGDRQRLLLFWPKLLFEKESKTSAAGANPIGIRRGIEAAVPTAVNALKETAIPVSHNKEARI